MFVHISDPNLYRRRRDHDWKYLCNQYLPIRPKSSVWWFSRKRTRNDLLQGWKLHVSATILSACKVFRLVAPYLARHKILFKAVKSPYELEKLNRGAYGFSQVGKFITVYPPSTESAVAVASALAALTANEPAPIVPYDDPVCGSSCVYYRYGVFFDKRKVIFRGRRVSAIERTDGKLVRDRREPGAAVPSWLADPFIAIKARNQRERLTPLETRYGNYKALTQRGRGGVYRAFELSSKRRNPCVINEGRLICEGEPQKVICDPQVRECYWGKEQMECY